MTEPKKPQGSRNPEASLQQKLRSYARATSDDVSLVLTRYINERFLYRLSVSDHRKRFILRGATLFTLWNAEPHRATRDIDLLASGDSSPDTLRRVLIWKGSFLLLKKLFSIELGQSFRPMRLLFCAWLRSQCLPAQEPAAG